MDRFDVVVVGARCAGSPLATLLARRGLRVCMLDKARFPSDAPSTHVLQPAGVAALARLGVLPALDRAGAVPVRRATLVVADARVEGELPGGPPGLCVRRTTLDAMLVETAATAGVDVRTSTKVLGLIAGEGRVTGVRTAAGELGAPLVVGADGRHSIVARAVRAPERHVVPAGRLTAWAYFSGVAEREARLRLGRLDDLGFLACPTDGGLYLAGVSPSYYDRAGFLSDKARNFTEALRAWPELADLLAGGTREGPIRVVADWRGYLRPAAGPGWALVGDAGNFKDPTPAQGITDALRQAERLAVAIESGLGADIGIDAALDAWSRWRDRDALKMHWFAADLGAAGPPRPIVTQFLRNLADEPDGPLDLMRVLNRDIPPAELLSARRLGRAVVGALRRRPRETRAVLHEIRAEARAGLRRAGTRLSSRTAAPAC